MSKPLRAPLPPLVVAGRPRRTGRPSTSTPATSCPSAEELGTEPDATSQGLREEILAGRFPRVGPESRPPEEGAADEKHNLPNLHSSFVGREQELVEVKRALAMTGLLTLTGTGGCGKTRLALEVARDLVGVYPDGVWLVGLASFSNPALVPQAVASVLGVREQPGRSLTETLSHYLEARQTLLVLDNCEHLIDACARLVDMLLSSCEHLRILATSREVLGVAGEANWPVLPLVVPDVEWLPPVEDLTRYEAVRLFLDRACSKLPTFSLEPKNARAVSAAWDTRWRTREITHGWRSSAKRPKRF